MSFLMNPILPGLLDTQMSNIGYVVRGWSRLDGEKIGLPQAVPDQRKMDYMFRDFFMVITSAFVTELTYRMVEQGYVIPNFIHLLQFDRLSKLYTPDSIHTPNFAKGMAVQDINKQFPKVLRSHMLSTLVNPRSYYSVPDILEKAVIPKLVKEKKLTAEEAKQARLWAHHLRKTVNPKDYINRFLLAQGRIDQREARTLLAKLEQMERLTTVLDKGKGALTPQEMHARLQAMLKSNPTPAVKALASVTVEELEKSAVKPGLRHYLKVPFSRNPLAQLRTIGRMKALHANPVLAQLRKTPGKDLDKAYNLIQRYAKHPVLKDTPLVRDLGRCNKTQLWQKLQGPPTSSLWKNARKQGFKAAWEAHRVAKSYALPSELMAKVRESLLLPMMDHRYGATSRLASVFKEMSLSKSNYRAISKVFEGSGFWLKLPMSILTLFLVFGVAANKFDAQILQPYQRKVVEQHGDAKAAVQPGFLGAIPCLATFFLLLKNPWAQKLGYVGSFALASVGGLAAYIASTWAMFQANLNQSRGGAQASGAPLPPPAPVKNQPVSSPRLTPTASASPFVGSFGQPPVSMSPWGAAYPSAPAGYSAPGGY